MFMKKKWILILLFIFFLGTFVVYKNRTQGDLKEIRVGGKKVTLIGIAKTEEEREKGLSERQSLCENCGLLFVFDPMGIYPFWMRRMYFDVDIIWIAGDKVVDITEGVKKPSTADLDQPKELYMSKVEIDKALEVNAGLVKKNNIFVGDKVEY